MRKQEEDPTQCENAKYGEIVIQYLLHTNEAMLDVVTQHDLNEFVVGNPVIIVVIAQTNQLLDCALWQTLRKVCR